MIPYAATPKTKGPPIITPSPAAIPPPTIPPIVPNAYVIADADALPPVNPTTAAPVATVPVDAAPTPIFRLCFFFFLFHISVI